MTEAVVDLQSGASIELRLEELSQLFDPFDPFPIPTCDLAVAAGLAAALRRQVCLAPWVIGWLVGFRRS